VILLNLSGFQKPFVIYLSFFVYGTLLPGQPNYGLWRGRIESEQEATFANGRLYDMGYYPMLVEGEVGRVQGLLITVRPQEYEAVVMELDALEGYDPGQPDACAYCRVERSVTLIDGRSVSAWVYLGHSRYVSELTPVTGGDWARYVADKMDQITAWWQDMTTVWGLHRPPDESEG
jgi:gamma-glutamylcyclotransferase (GGCT)/AIG2-like uncharacterized protein YtfP